MRAIWIACHDRFLGVTSGLSDGLRAIRRFEKFNGIYFDTFEKRHVNAISGCGPHELFFRNAKRCFRKYESHV